MIQFFLNCYFILIHPNTISCIILNKFYDENHLWNPPNIKLQLGINYNPMTRKTILCYGDSITWGYNPANQNRMTFDERWPGVLDNGLGEDYKVIEEGLNGRTTIRDDPVNNCYKNGLKYLVPCLESHKPIDMCILLLGTNDLKKRFGLSATEIANGIRILVDTIKKSASGPRGFSSQNSFNGATIH